MSALVISGDTSGQISVTVPAVAGSNTITLPAGTGTAAIQGVSTNIVASTTVASTSGTAIDFTNIPAYVKRITVLFNAVSTSGTADPMVQIGSGSIATTGYNSQGFRWSGSAGANTPLTTGVNIAISAATNIIYAAMTIYNMGSNVWFFNLSGQDLSSNNGYISTGVITLSGAPDRLRITTANGTDTFDAGSVNILYE